MISFFTATTSTSILLPDSIQSITGILNGTCNFVLSRMEEGMAWDDALRDARDRGFAEADPTMDLSGQDAEQKITILAGLAFGEPIRRIERGGITGVTTSQLRGARAAGRVLRQVADARRVAGGAAVSVGLRALPAEHPLARLQREENGVTIRGRAVGDVFLSGRGAGSLPTASAVLSDVIAVARGPWRRAVA